MPGIAKQSNVGASHQILTTFLLTMHNCSLMTLATTAMFGCTDATTASGDVQVGVNDTADYPPTPASRSPSTPPPPHYQHPQGLGLGRRHTLPGPPELHSTAAHRNGAAGVGGAGRQHSSPYIDAKTYQQLVWADLANDIEAEEAIIEDAWEEAAAAAAAAQQQGPVGTINTAFSASLSVVPNVPSSICLVVMLHRDDICWARVGLIPWQLAAFITQLLQLLYQLFLCGCVPCTSDWGLLASCCCGHLVCTTDVLPVYHSAVPSVPNPCHCPSH